MKSRLPRLFAAFLAVGLLAFLVGCGGSSDDDSSGETTATSTTETGGGSASGFDAAKFEAIAAKGAIPDSFPKIPPAPTPKQGTTLALIVCAMELEGCKAAADGLTQAAKVIGFGETKVLDSESKPAKTVSSFEQAKQLGYEGIIMVALDKGVTEPLVAAARKSGVEVVGLASGQPEGYNSNPSPTGPSAEFERDEKLIGELSAANIILEKEGKANVLLLSIPEFETISNMEAGFRAVMEQCEECEITEEIQFTSPDTTTTLPTQVRAKVTANPDINAVWAGADAFLTAVNPTIEQLGNEDVKTYGVDGQKVNIEEIAEGGVQAGTISCPPDWQSFAAIDQMNRVVNGEKPATVQECPPLVVTPENADEFLNEQESPIDYQAGYEELWGIK